MRQNNLSYNPLRRTAPLKPFLIIMMTASFSTNLSNSNLFNSDIHSEGLAQLGDSFRFLEIFYIDIPNHEPVPAARFVDVKDPHRGVVLTLNQLRRANGTIQTLLKGWDGNILKALDVAKKADVVFTVTDIDYVERRCQYTIDCEN